MVQPLRLSRLFIFVLFVTAFAISPAQMSRWQLGNPSLILDLPGNPSGGGVEWHERDVYSFLTTSWSSESSDARIEVSSRYTSDTPQVLANSVATKLGGQVSNSKAIKISGQDGLQFTVGSRSGIAISGGGKGWIVIGTPKTGQGASVVSRSLSSILVERAGTARWVRRSLGGTRMHAELPFDFAEDFSRPAEGATRAYELFWDDMEITAFVQTASEGMKIDYEGSIKSYLDGESKAAGTEDFKSKRERLKLDKLTGDLLTLDFSRNKKTYRVRSFFALDSGRMLRMSINTQPSRSEQEEAADRIVRTFKVSGVSFEGFAPRQVGTEPLWVDLPRDLESKGNGLYGVFIGAFGTDVRVTPVNPSAGHNEDQLAEFITIKYQGREGIKDFKADTSRRLVDGLEARVVRASYKGKTGQKTHEVAIAIFAADAIYTIETIVGESEVEYVDRILDSVRFETRAPAGWSRQMIGESGFSALWPGKAEGQLTGQPNADVEKTLMYEMKQDGFIGNVIEIKAKSAIPSVGVLLPTFAKSIAQGMGGTYEILDQRPIDVGTSAGMHAKLSFTLNGKTLPGDIIVLRKGVHIWTLVVVYDVSTGKSVLRQALINSIK